MKRYAPYVQRNLRWALVSAGFGLGLWLLGFAMSLFVHKPVMQSNLFFVGYILMMFGILLAAMTMASLGRRD